MRDVLVQFTLLAAVLVGGQSANAATIWVSPSASGPAPGISCSIAGYATIQGAINAANAGDTVYVCPGSYLETITIVFVVRGAVIFPAAAALAWAVLAYVCIDFGFWSKIFGTQGQSDGQLYRRVRCHRHQSGGDQQCRDGHWSQCDCCGLHSGACGFSREI